MSALARLSLDLLLLRGTLTNHLRVLVHREGGVLVEQTVVELLVVVHAAVAALTVVIRGNVLAQDLTT